MIFTNFREIDGAGRIVISKDIRNHLNIKAGDMLHIEADNDCITIKKQKKMHFLQFVRKSEMS